jgi:hypothetical protein
VKLWLIVRRPMCDEDESSDPLLIAKLAREMRELAQERLGYEVVVDCVPPDLPGWDGP